MTTTADNIAAAFLDHAHETPNNLFLRLNTGAASVDYSYADIMAGSCRANSYFRAQGLPKGSVVAIILTHSVELYTAFLGAMMAGMVPTIIPFPTPKQDRAEYWVAHRKLFELSGIRSVFTYTENVADIRTHLEGCIDLIATAQDVGTSSCEDIEPGNLAVLQHSSGTTALKKGVMLTHTAIFAQVAAYSSAIGISRGDRIATWLPLYHDMGFISCFLMPMILGCPLVHIDAFVWSARPTLLLDEIVTFGAHYVWLPNFAYNHIANALRGEKSWNMSSIRAIINCSEPCKPSTFARFASLEQLKGLKPEALQVCYAMAENVFAVSQTALNAPPKTVAVTTASLRGGHILELGHSGEEVSDILSCGYPVAGTKVAIRGSNGPEETDLRLGEIVIRGNSLYSGYYHRPEITAARLVDGWHHTGDVGFLCEGQVYVTGRVDDLLIIRGKNIYAHEVEEAINSLDLIIPGRAVALAVFDKSKGDANLVVLAEGNDLSAEKEIATAARRIIVDRFGVSLGDFRLFAPRTLRKTTSGKLSRVSNAQLYQEVTP